MWSGFWLWDVWRDILRGGKWFQASLWESVSRLMPCSVWWPSCRRRWQTEENSRICQRGIGQWNCTLPSLSHGSQISMATMEKGPGSALCQEKGSFTRGQERWKKATAQGRKGKLSSPSKLLLQSRCGALGTLGKAHEVEEEPIQEILSRSERPTPCNKTCNKPAPRRNKSEL